MKKILLAYYSFGEASKVAERFHKLLITDGHNVETYLIADKNKKGIKNTFKKKSILSLKRKEIELENELPKTKEYDLIIVGTPIISFSSAPIVNHFLKNIPIEEDKKFVLFSTGIGLPGTTIKQMQSYLSMRKAKLIDSQVFSSIFPFDEKKLKEVDEFYNKIKSALLKSK